MIVAVDSIRVLATHEMAQVPVGAARGMRAALRTRTLAVATMLAVATLFAPSAAQAQAPFPTPEAAFDALVDGLARHDDAEVKRALGPNYAKVLPLGDVSETDRTDFLAAGSPAVPATQIACWLIAPTVDDTCSDR